MKFTILFKNITEDKKDKLFYAYDEKTKAMYIIDLKGIKVRLRDVLGSFFICFLYIIGAGVLFLISLIFRLHWLLYVGIFLMGWGHTTYMYKTFDKISDHVLMKQQFELYPEVQLTEQSLEQNFDFFNDKMTRTESANKKVIIISTIMFLICTTCVVYYQIFNFQVILLLIFAVLSSYSLLFIMQIVQSYILPKRRKETMYHLKIEKRWKVLRKEITYKTKKKEKKRIGN